MSKVEQQSNNSSNVERSRTRYRAQRRDDDENCSSCLQFGALMKKNFLEKRRDVVATLLEFGLPILFVVGSVILWAAFNNNIVPSEQFISYEQPGVFANPSTSTTAFRSTICYNETVAPAGIDGIPKCDFTTGNFTCYNKHDPTVPVDGLCTRNTNKLLAPQAFLQYFVYGSAKSLHSIPSLDDMIALQWMTRLTIANTRLFNTPITAMSTSGKLYFAPSGPETDGLVAYFNSTSKLFRYVYGGTLPTAKEAEGTVTQLDNEGKVWGIVAVNKLTTTQFDVEIRLNHTAAPDSTKIVNAFYLGGIKEDNKMYLFNGFCTLQSVISKYYLENVVAVGSVVTPPLVVPMGFAAYSPQAFLNFGGSVIPLLVVLGFLYPVSQLAKRIVQEKELRIREAMFIMGLGPGSFYAAWIVAYVIQHVFVSIIITIILKNTYLTRANNGVVFFTFFFFELSTISLGGLISAFFSKARLAAIVTPLVYFATSIPLFVIQTSSPGTRRSLLILSPTAFANGVLLLFQHELAGGLGNKDVTTSKDDPNMISILIMLAIDTLIYFFLWLYVDAVMPSDWGTSRSCCYCYTDPIKWVWRQICGLAGARVSDELPDGRSPTGVFEDAPMNDQTSVQIVGLRKVFERGGNEFVAVNNLYWTMQEGEISVLLGHNGAGKSTTMNMMTGMLEADDGDCFIYGYSVRTELDMVRREIGYCPQHNVLWPDLTCAEHLAFYATIKGITGVERDEAVQRMLEAVDLMDKRDYLSSALSGGQKRKLSVAIAFVGGSRLIFLDEPTAGMDVGARRHTWDLLRKMSTTHTILLTTHFMDEADLLGHTIAIMNAGSLQCSGSSLFLKSRLGVGYNIVMSVEAHVDTHRIDNEVRSHVSEAQLLSNSPGEISYRLPTAAMSAFPALLGSLEDNGRSFGVRNVSISATTLEEIFLQIAHGESARPILAHVATDREGEELSLLNDPTTNHSATNVKQLRLDVPRDQQGPGIQSIWTVNRIEAGSLDLFLSQMKVTLAKRFKNSLRDRRTQCLQIITPVVCILFAMLFTLINIFASPPIVLSPEAYGEQVSIDISGCASLFGTSVTIPGAVVSTPSGVGNALNMSNYLVSTANFHGNMPRYSAITCFDGELKAAANLSAAASVVFFNVSAFHEMPIGLHTYFDGIYRNAVPDHTMKLIFNPLPKTARESALADSIKSMLIGLIIMIPFTFIPSTFVAWIVKERECKARHLQNVSGLGFGVYWLSNFLFDILSFAVTVFLALMVFLIFNRTEYISAQAIGATIVLFLFYGLAAVSFAYATSFLFEIHSTAQNIVMLVNFIAGFLLVLVVFILGLVDSTKSAANVLQYIFRFVPSYCLGDGIINLALLQVKQTFGDKSSPWNMDIIGWDILYTALEFPIVFAITLFIDHPARRMKTQALLHNPDAVPEIIENEEDDVAAERQEVETAGSTRSDSDLVVVRNLRKVYDNGKVAVKNLSFGVHPGEVFGFLGTNGAGKTTAISILCQEFFPTSGRAFIVGKDIVDNAEQALRCIGYCPQFDALLDLLTVEEHLYLYAGIRGIVEKERPQVVTSLAELCELTNYLPTVACELSGGNKRKLSVALSLIGGPSVVFLDEPSAGMDPMARRGLWTAVESLAENCAVVLTTHHLEEVEALAHRVAIMVDGTLRCIGDKLHLKHKYGSGFELSLRVSSEADCAAVERFVKENIKEAKLDEYRSLRFTFALPQQTKLSSMFGLIQKHKEELNITDYSISQTSIEQVFLRISASAEAGDE